MVSVTSQHSIMKNSTQLLRHLTHQRTAPPQPSERGQSRQQFAIAIHPIDVVNRTRFFLGSSVFGRRVFRHIYCQTMCHCLVARLWPARFFDTFIAKQCVIDWSRVSSGTRRALGPTVLGSWYCSAPLPQRRVLLWLIYEHMSHRQLYDA